MANRIFVILFIALMSVSCESDYESTLITQEENIDKYISENLKDFEVVHNGGSNRVILSEGYGNPVEKGDIVDFSYEAYIFGTNGPTSLYAKDDMRGVSIGEGNIIKGLDLGIIGTKQNEQDVILFSARYGYGKNAMNVVPEQSALLFLVKINSVSKQQK